MTAARESRNNSECISCEKILPKGNHIYSDLNGNSCKECFEGEKQVASYGPILREAADIADERGEKYGEVLENFQDTCYIYKANFGDDGIDPVILSQVLIALKISREKNCHQDDNCIDKINYEAIRLYIIRHQHPEPQSS